MSFQITRMSVQITRMIVQITNRVLKSHAGCQRHTHDVKITQSGIFWQSYFNFSWFV
jgi:hypothetical protein